MGLLCQSPEAPASARDDRQRPACLLPCDLSLPPLLFHGLRRRKQHPSEGQCLSLPALGSRCPFRGRLPRVRAPPLGARTPGQPPIPRPLPRAAERRPRWVRRPPALGAASAPRELPPGPTSRKGSGRAGQRPLRGVRAPSAGHGAEVGLVARQGPAGLCRRLGRKHHEHRTHLQGEGGGGQAGPGEGCRVGVTPEAPPAPPHTLSGPS